jgi:hypothetical protein
MTAVSQFLGNGLLEALRNCQHPLLVTGCIDTYSRSNKQSLRDNRKTQLLGNVFSVSWRTILRARRSTDS